MDTPSHILLCRTDSIGDTLLTLPMAGFIKDHFANGVRISYLGTRYTRDVVGCCKDVDHFLTKEELFEHGEARAVEVLSGLGISHSIHVFPDKDVSRVVKAAHIPHRIGTSHRLFHLSHINHLVHFTRKRSSLHEAQLNFKLLSVLGMHEIPSLNSLHRRMVFQAPKASEDVLSMASGGRPVILHPGSRGSAVEWGQQNFMDLAKRLADEGVPVIFTGTEQEGAQFRDQIPEHELITDATGQLDLSELIALIGESWGLVACSTGPLHIAGILGKYTFGLFVPRRPVHPGRWQPLGDNVEILMYDADCSKCHRGMECECLKDLDVSTVAEHILLARNDSK